MSLQRSCCAALLLAACGGAQNAEETSAPVQTTDELLAAIHVTAPPTAGGEHAPELAEEKKEPTPAELFTQWQQLEAEAKEKGNDDGQTLQAEADERLLKAARGGHPPAIEAARQKAWPYIGNDDAKAFSWMIVAAEQGDAVAQDVAGEMFEYGQGAAKDLAQAELWYQRAVAQGHQRAMYRLGLMRWRAKQYDEGRALIEMAANRGDADAAVELGRIYRNGDHVQQDYQRGIDWLQKGADGGSASAQFLLGTVYWQGEGVMQDYARAASYLEKAAAQGHATSMWLLGAMHERGDYYARDDAAAASWYEKAAAKGERAAQEYLAAMLEWGRGVRQDLPRAAELYRQACDAERWKACTALGKMLNDKDEAARLFNKACDQGEYDACKQVGRREDVFSLKRRMLEQRKFEIPKTQ